MAFYTQKADGSIIIRVYIQPNAGSDEIAGIHGDSLKVKIKAPPVKGKANQECEKFLAETLGLPKSMVSLLKGRKSKHKQFRIQSGDDDLLKRVTSLPH